MTELHQLICKRPCILFDYDGTIADTLPGIVNTARIVLTEYGLSEEELGDLTRLVGPPFPQAFSMIYGVSEEDAARITEHYRAIYNKQDGNAWPAFPGMVELLHDLAAAGHTLGIVSSKRTHLVERGVVDNGLTGVFAQVRGRQDDDLHGETKAQAIVAAARELGFDLDEVVMVGDRFYDVDAACEAGVPCVGVYFGNTAPQGELEAAGAAAVAHSVEDLRQLLLGEAV